MKCPHYHICIRESENLCVDPKCKLNRQLYDSEEEQRKIELEKIFKAYKKGLGVNSFLDLNN